MKSFFSILLLAAAAAHAETGDFHAGLRFGNSMENRLPQNFSNIDSKTPFGVTGTYEFTDTFGVEVGFADLGKSKVLAVADAGFDLSGSLWTIGGTAQVPLNARFSALVGLGYFKLNEDGSSQTLIGPRRLDNSGSGAYVELGGRFAINDQFGARLSYQHFNFDNGSDGTPWLGLEARF
jgi:OmpA-OmpF porin, OOP family